jgi:A/G-specific adenine glycosylase
MPDTLTPATIDALRRHFLNWFSVNARDLPWRQGYDPYQVWVSEIMLQQTQMERGVLYFKRWLTRFPGVEAVATASEEEILKQWEGLGYYSRARNIQAAARQIVREHGGELPATLHGLLALPGIGRYTARAILSIAFQQDQPVVDGNVERLFARLFAIDEPVKAPSVHARIWSLAEALLPPGLARAWNQALMEFGALVCVRATPLCQLCPATQECLSFQTNTTEQRPVAGATAKTIPVRFVAAVISDGQGRLLVRQRPAGVRWAGLWEFPNAPLAAGEEPGLAVVRAVQEETRLAISIQRPLPLVTHSFTKYRATIHPFFCHLQGQTTSILHTVRTYRWLTLNGLDTLAFSAGHRQVIGILQGLCL